MSPFHRETTVPTDNYYLKLSRREWKNFNPFVDFDLHHATILQPRFLYVSGNTCVRKYRFTTKLWQFKIAWVSQSQTVLYVRKKKKVIVHAKG